MQPAPPPTPLVLAVAVVGGVALGLSVITGPGVLELSAGVLASAAAVGAAIRWELGVRRVAGLTAVSFVVAALSGTLALDAWQGRTRRDTSRDDEYADHGFLVRAEPGFTTRAVGDGPDEYCATMEILPYREPGFADRTGITETTVDGRLLASRCDLTPRLFEKIIAADQAGRDVEVVVLSTLVTDGYRRPALDSYRFLEELTREQQARLRQRPGWHW